MSEVSSESFQGYFRALEGKKGTGKLRRDLAYDGQYYTKYNLFRDTVYDTNSSGSGYTLITKETVVKTTVDENPPMDAATGLPKVVIPSVKWTTSGTGQTITKHYGDSDLKKLDIAIVSQINNFRKSGIPRNRTREWRLVQEVAQLKSEREEHAKATKAHEADMRRNADRFKQTVEELHSAKRQNEDVLNKELKRVKLERDQERAERSRLEEKLQRSMIDQPAKPNTVSNKTKASSSKHVDKENEEEPQPNQKRSERISKQRTRQQKSVAEGSGSKGKRPARREIIEISD